MRHWSFVKHILQSSVYQLPKSVSYCINCKTSVSCEAVLLTDLWIRNWTCHLVILVGTMLFESLRLHSHWHEYRLRVSECRL